MNRISKYLILAFLLTLSKFTYGQVLDEETGFIYVKAEYLFETGRFEEAITNYNSVISKDPKYKNALIHRGQAKLALAAYKGAKMDAIQSIELQGITAEAAALLGRSAQATNESESAIHNLSAAIALDPKNTQYYEWRAAIYESGNQLLRACNDYEMAMHLGSALGENKAKILCGITKQKTKPKSDQPVVTQDDDSSVSKQPTENKNPGELGENEVLSSGNQESDESKSTHTNPVVVDDSEPQVDESLPKNDNTVNSLVIDDDLTLEISGQELGKRKVKEIPSILILADENGRVTLNICVNKSGVVTKAEFNGTLSTIAKKSLVSLALRKAKEFEFVEGQYDLQCGIMVFNIKGT